MNKVITIFLLVGVFILLMILVVKSNVQEAFNDQTGKFCYDCDNKTINQCMQCFNCGFCVDKNGNGKCIPGDHTGPWNKEDCYQWHYGDPFSYMLQINKRDNRRNKCDLGKYLEQRGMAPTYL
jgi:hypothetical protein